MSLLLLLSLLSQLSQLSQMSLLSLLSQVGRKVGFNCLLYSKAHFFTTMTDGRTDRRTTRLLELLRAAKNHATSQDKNKISQPQDKKNYALFWDKKITQALGTKKIMQPLGTEKKSRNLLGLKRHDKINYATSWDGKK